DRTCTSRCASAAIPRTRGRISRSVAAVHKLLVVGGGKMGEALAGGLLKAKWASPNDIAILEKLPFRRAEIGALHPGLRVVSEPEPAEAAVIAVKPGDVEHACGLARDAGVRRVLSIAAGVRI